MSKAFRGLKKAFERGGVGDQILRNVDQALAVDGQKPSGLNSTDPEKRDAAENTFGVTSVKNVFANLGMQPIGVKGIEGKPLDTPQTTVVVESQPQVATNKIEAGQPQEPVLQPQAEPEKPVVVNTPEVVALRDPVNDNPLVQEAKIENPINVVETQEQGAEPTGYQLQDQEGTQQPVAAIESNPNPDTEKGENGNSEVALETKHGEKSIIPASARPIDQEAIKDLTMKGLYHHCIINPENNNEILYFQFYYDETKPEETTPPLGSSLEIDSTNS